jgi:glycosyltransferase involved in cell wall biosynthesis
MKRIEELIVLFGRARPPNCRLVIVGPGEHAYVQRLMDARRDTGLESIIELRGPAFGRDKERLYAAVDGFVSFSARENFGFVAAEALAAGVPVILSAGNDLGYDLRDVDCGWCLDDDRDESLIAVLQAFAVAPASRLETMGANGRRWVMQHLSFAAFRSRIINLASEAVSPLSPAT